jgi:hypothetical protein
MVLIVSAGLALALLLVPDRLQSGRLSQDDRGSFRSTGGQLLVLSVPLLSAALVVVGAGYTGSKRIDHVTQKFLERTCAVKLERYLVGMGARKRKSVGAVGGRVTGSGLRQGRDASPEQVGETCAQEPGETSPPSDWLLAPPFEGLETRFDKDTPSYCRYRFFNEGREGLVVWVKCNVLNFEVNVGAELEDAWPRGGRGHLTIKTEDDFTKYNDCRAASVVKSTLSGAISEGYQVAIDPDPDNDSKVWWQIRLKLTERVILSPVLRRYFAEDAAIFVYWLEEDLKNDRETRDRQQTAETRGPEPTS